MELIGIYRGVDGIDRDIHRGVDGVDPDIWRSR